MNQLKAYLTKNKKLNFHLKKKIQDYYCNKIVTIYNN